MKNIFHIILIIILSSAIKYNQYIFAQESKVFLKHGISIAIKDFKDDFSADYSGIYSNEMVDAAMLTKIDVKIEKKQNLYIVTESYWFGSEDTYPDEYEENYKRKINATIKGNKISCKPIIGKFVFAKVTNASGEKIVKGILSDQSSTIYDDGGKKTKHYSFFLKIE